MMKNTAIAVVLALTAVSGLSAQGLYGRGKTLFSDLRAHAVGDIVTIEIVEVAQASNEMSTQTQKSQENNIDASGSGPLDFIPLTGLKSEINNDYSGKGKTTSKGNLKAKMTARIVEVLPNGNFLIEGSRVVDVNGDKQMTILTGVIRPEDITPQNTVYSYNIAEAQISYKGRGPANSGARPGILARIINWLF